MTTPQPVVVDTNVAVVANRAHEEASPHCVLACATLLKEIGAGEWQLVLDDAWQILGEYKKELRSSGQPGVGDAFLKWVLTNRTNPARCAWTHISPCTEHDYAEFPDDPALDGFDHSDRKFVAVALAHPDKPPIANAVDTDWWDYREPLAQHGVQVRFLCEGEIKRTVERRGS